MLLIKKNTIKTKCRLNKVLSIFNTIEEFTYENFWEETAAESDFGNFALQMYVHKHNNIYRIIKELSTETWFLCTDKIKITYVPIHLYEEFCFDYKSSKTIKWRVYKTEETYVAICVSCVKEPITTNYNHKCKLLAKNIDHFLVLNRSFHMYIKQSPHKLSFIEEIGHGPVNMDIYKFAIQLPAIFDIYKHYPPHYIRLFHTQTI